MIINLSQIENLSNSVRSAGLNVYNMFPYLIYALDIYFLCDDPDIYNFLLTPIGSEAKISIQIDGVTYPIKFGSPGESPTNPIIYKRQTAFSNVHVLRNSTPYEMIGTDSTENETIIEKHSDISSSVTIGTNVNAGDKVWVTFIISSQFTLDTKLFCFGGQELNGTKNDGYGGLALSTDLGTGANKNIEGFGGIMPATKLEKAVFVIERSNYLDLGDNGEVTYGIN